MTAEGESLIAIAEDNAGDVELVREALDSSGLNYRLLVRRDGEQMLDLLDEIETGNAEPPDLVLLDLNLPRATGEAVLEKTRQSAATRAVPVIVMTSSDSPRDREAARQRGANAYFRKPSDFDEFILLGNLIRELLQQSHPPD